MAALIHRPHSQTSPRRCSYPRPEQYRAVILADKGPLEVLYVLIHKENGFLKMQVKIEVKV